jgi:FkbM family methyltransferase
MNKPRVYYLFRAFAKRLSGHGWRERFGVIDRIYKYLNRGLAPSTAKVHGYTMYIDPYDSMGLAIGGVYEPLETTLVRELIRPGQVILDIGANIGYYTLLFSQQVGSSGLVFAFEPDPQSFQLLQKNIFVNNIKNTSIFQLAVADEEKDQTLYRDRFNNLDHRIVKPDWESEAVRIRSICLDSFYSQCSPRLPDFIKMDIQGAEGYALEGMKNLLAQSGNLILLTEFWPAGLNQGGYGAEIFLRKLTSLGFSLSDTLDQSTGSAPATIQALLKKYPPTQPGHTNLLCKRQAA